METAEVDVEVVSAAMTEVEEGLLQGKSTQRIK